MNLEKEKGPRVSQHHMGWNVQRTFPLLPVAGEIFPLTFPLIERGNRRVDFWHGELTGFATIGRYFRAARDSGARKSRACRY